MDATRDLAYSESLTVYFPSELMLREYVGSIRGFGRVTETGILFLQGRRTRLFVE